MSTPNYPTQSQNDAKYATPASVTSAIASQAANDAGQYLQRRGLNAVALGDSLTSQQLVVGSGGTPQNGYGTIGYLTWMQHHTTHRLTVTNMGVPGENSLQILARVPAVIAASPRYVFELSGTNDPTSSFSAATTITNRKAIIDALIASGSTVIALTIPPRTGVDDSVRTHEAGVNNWLLNYGRTKPGLYVVNITPLLTDPSTGEYNAADQADGTHFSPTGAVKVGKVVATLLNTLVPSIDDRPFWNADPSNFLPNGLFVDGTTLATSWQNYTISGSPTFTKAARRDGVSGNAQRVVTVSADDVLVYSKVNATGSIAPGATVQGEIAYDLDAGELYTQFALNVTFYNSGGFQISYNGDMVNVFSSLPAGSIATNGLLQTPPVVVPAGCAQIGLEMRLTGTGAVQLNWARLNAVG